MKLRDIAAKLGCELEGDPAIEITGVSGLEDAQPGDLRLPRDLSEVAAEGLGRELWFRVAKGRSGLTVTAHHAKICPPKQVGERDPLRAALIFDEDPAVCELQIFGFGFHERRSRGRNRNRLK